ncbi:Acyl dehydratase [Catalinimonas alkaloidigena]|uniref:Acyl dehydratase n=1 Tax=Catalinimonas alkaloidigena TaxID=1075417 RepID=A0A1G9AG95_9BACT|nr:MaoC family dehydratase [Catalinimonas alkaloidigena]SDK26253.1 Acyl dehydratase [Catalinimonas alkaloidigena]
MLQPDDTFTQALRYTQADVDRFADVTGDHNPIHSDPDYAAQTPFRRPIIHGMLSAGVFSRVLGTQFPGEGTIYLRQTLDFKRPMYVDTDYEAVLTVQQVDREKHRAVVTTTIRDGAGKVTVQGEAEIMHRTLL